MARAFNPRASSARVGELGVSSTRGGHLFGAALICRDLREVFRLSVWRGLVALAISARPSRQQRRASAPVAYLARDDAPVLSPLRYPGSKRRLAPYIAYSLELNDLEPQLFIEPFAGGASVALQLLIEERVEEIGLADADPLVAAFWQTVFHDTDWLVQRVRDVRVTLRNWKHFKMSTARSRRDRAIACLFLNRTSFSGIMAPNAGPIGGQAQTSKYRIDCRFPRNRLIERIRTIAALRDRVAFVWNCSWNETLDRATELQRSLRLGVRDVFYYFDPPFFEKAASLYARSFTDDDHTAFRNEVLRLRKAKWLISYDAAPRVRQLYGDRVARVMVEQLYSASSRGLQPEREAIITNLSALPTATRVWRRSAEWGRPRGDRANQ